MILLTAFEVVSVIREEALHSGSTVCSTPLFFLLHSLLHNKPEISPNRSLETQELRGYILLQDPKLETVTGMFSMNQCYLMPAQ